MSELIPLPQDLVATCLERQLFFDVRRSEPITGFPAANSIVMDITDSQPLLSSYKLPSMEGIRDI